MDFFYKVEKKVFFSVFPGDQSRTLDAILSEVEKSAKNSPDADEKSSKTSSVEGAAFPYDKIGTYPIFFVLIFD